MDLLDYINGLGSVLASLYAWAIGSAWSSFIIVPIVLALVAVAGRLWLGYISGGE